MSKPVEYLIEFFKKHYFFKGILLLFTMTLAGIVIWDSFSNKTLAFVGTFTSILMMFFGFYLFIRFKGNFNDKNSELNEDIIHRTEQLAIINKELEAFTYSVSHDLRAPLRAINSYAQILQEDYSNNLDEEGNRILKNITYNAQKMGNLIDELLEFSRLGRKEIKRTKVNINELAHSVVNELNISYPNQANIIIHPLAIADADYSMMYQVMLNLISNAIKYSSKKSNPQVEIFMAEQNGKSCYAVKDNGAGFDMRFSDKLFGVFQRLHSENEFEGNGVGLAIVHRIIEKYDGDIWAESKLEEGAIFYFTLNK